MAKFHGKVGYVTTEEVRQGVHRPVVTERIYSGDILQFGNRHGGDNKINEDTSLSNQISILSDPFTRKHFNEIKYVVWMGTSWNVSSVSVEFPRLTLTLGGVYTGERPSGT